MTLFIIVFVAALMQSSTGIGFGLVVAPILLLSYETIDALQIISLLTLSIAIVVGCIKTRHINKRALKHLLLGTAIGLPAGCVLVYFASSYAIQVMSLTIMLYGLGRYIQSFMSPAKHTTGTHSLRLKPVEGSIYGFISGTMSTSLAMPGPMAMLYLVKFGLPHCSFRIFGDLCRKESVFQSCLA